MTRIVLLGCAGAGKSTLGKRLAAATGARFICLDDLSSTGGVAPEQVPAFRALMAELHAAEAWISDGNFAAVTFDIRLPRADRIVWLAPPRLLCAARAVRRVFRPGEAHQLSGLGKALAFIWNFERVNRPRIEMLIAEHGPDLPQTRLRTAGEVEAFIASVSAIARPAGPGLS
jgi:adenylate kinase family enzyme